MTKAEYRSFLQSAEWKSVRAKCLERSKQGNHKIQIGRCEKCGYIPWRPQSLQCHHVNYNVPKGKTLKDALLDMDSIQVLCVNCHKAAHQITNGLSQANTLDK